MGNKNLRAIILAITILFGINLERALAETPVESLRLELSLLGSQIEDLRSALLSPEVRSLAPGDAGIALLRLDALEAKVRATVGRVEALEFHLQILSKDAKHRIREFGLRLSELEGESVERVKDSIHGLKQSGAKQDNVEEISNETLAFDSGIISYNSENYELAIKQFQAFLQTYPSSINIPEVYYWLGVSKLAVGDYKSAASDLLESFSLAPSGLFAWKALLRLASALGDLGQIEQACLTLGELKSRFPKQVDKNLNEILTIEEPLKCSL